MVASNKKSVTVLLTDTGTEYKYLPDATNLVTCFTLFNGNGK